MRRSRIPIAAACVALMSTMVPASPVLAEGTPKPNQFWWPAQLNLAPLRQHAAESSPMEQEFNYADAFQSLDLNALKGEIKTLMTTSQPWWPADYGHYAPFSYAWPGTVRVPIG